MQREGSPTAAETTECGKVAISKITAKAERGHRASKEGKRLRIEVRESSIASSLRSCDLRSSILDWLKWISSFCRLAPRRFTRFFKANWEIIGQIGSDQSLGPICR